MIVFLCITLFVLLSVLIPSYISYRITFLSVKGKQLDLYHGLDDGDEITIARRNAIDRITKIPYEDVEITSYDGKRLHARYYHVRDGAPVAIQLHGYRSISIRDFSGGASECIELGQNVLLPDQRGHGMSEGKTIAFGIKERFDCIEWAKYVERRFGKDTKIILYGLSMGAATVLMASELPLPESVKAVVADCPYSDVGGIIKKVLRDMKLPVWMIFPFVWLGALIFGGFNLNASSPLKAVSSTKLPILLIHGSGDKFVPCTMSDDIAKAGKTVTYLKIPEARHGLSMVYDKDKYIATLKDFLKINHIE